MCTTPRNVVPEISFAEKLLPLCYEKNGVKYDYTCGARLVLPKNEQLYIVIIEDAETNTVLLEKKVQGGSLVVTPQKYYIKYHIKIFSQTDTTQTSASAGVSPEPFFEDIFDDTGKNVLFIMDFNTLGDPIAGIMAIRDYVKIHKCRPFIYGKQHVIDLFKHSYPEWTFLTKYTDIQDLYAAFRLGVFWEPDHRIHCCSDHRQVGLAQAMYDILGVSYSTLTPPRINLNSLEPDSFSFKKPYVCISVQSTTMAKNWSNPTGWIEVIKYLRVRGYDVYCIDKSNAYGKDDIWNTIPNGCIDLTGPLPLIERAAILKGASFFIGLASGLSWLAWSVGTPVIMISGFSLPVTEFHTPYRAFNKHVCGKCWNDLRFNFDHQDWTWCPLYDRLLKDSTTEIDRISARARRWECMKSINSRIVIKQIDALRQQEGV